MATKLWTIAKRAGGMRDSRKDLEALGFVVIKDNGLFYWVAPPKGFRRSTDGDWTDVINATGDRVFIYNRQLGCNSDNSAFVSFGFRG